MIEALDAAPADRSFLTHWVDEDEQEVVTFSEFRARARVQARLLRDEGIIAGDRVVIIMPQGIPAMAAFAGAMMIGAVPAFLAYPNFKVEASKYRSGLGGVTANLHAKLVVIDQEFPDDMLAHVSLESGARLIRASNTARISGADDFLQPIWSPESLAFIQHSAGTTGLQKGVALTHASVLNQLEHLARALRIEPATDRIYSWLPLYHDMGLIACFMLPMVHHVSVVMQSPLDWVMHPETMLQVIGEHKCTLAWLPNFAFQFVPRRTKQREWSQYDLSSVRALINCSEPVRASSMDEFKQAFSCIGLGNNALHSSYAMAESVFAVTQSDIDSPTGVARIWASGQRFRSEHQIATVAEGTRDSITFVSSGRVLPNNKVRIVSDIGEELSEGHVGEIFVQSDSMFDGYFNRHDLTAQAILNGWYRTGDLGFCLEGELYVVGRKKDLLIVGGENLYPQDIEEIVSQHPAIHEGRVVALGVFNPESGTEDILVVAEIDREELLETSTEIERQLRSQIVAAIGVAVRNVLLKPPKWIVKSTAGKPARAATREKLLQEHPEFAPER